MRRLLIAFALLAPAAAHADAITIFIALEAIVGATAATAIVVAGSWIAANAVYIALAYNVYSAQSARRAAKKAANQARDAYNRSLQDRTITALTAEPAERYFYGAGITGGDVVAIFTSDKVKDGKVKKDGYKHVVITCTSHRIKAIKDILIDGVRLGITGTTGWATAGEFAKSAEYDKTETASLSATSLTLSLPVYAILSVTARRGFGRVTQGVPYTLTGNTVNFPSGSGYPGATGWVVVYTVADTNNSTVYAEKFLGAEDQTANAYLMSKVPGQWTSSDRLRGRSGVVLTLDLEEPRLQGGIPRLSFDIEGRDEILDPRDDTLKYTTNPALCIDDWLRSTRWGFGVVPDVDSTIEAANACDVSTSFGTLVYPSDGIGPPTGSGFTGPRYTLNGGWTADDDKESVLGQMAASMGGRVIDGASWMIQAGSWTAPVLDLVDGDEAGPIQVLQTGESIDEIFNSVRASFLPASQATVADMNPPYQNSTFITADGRELWEVMTMPFTDQASRVRNLARIAVETARNGLVIQYPAKLKAWEVRPGQRVTVTNAEFAWTAKTFRVTDWQFGLLGAVVLTMQEDSEDAWDTADAAVVDPTPNTGLPNPNVVDPIADIDVDSGTLQLLRLDDGTIVPRAYVTWAQSESAYMDNGRVEIAWRNVLDVDWTVVNAAGADTSAYLLGVLDGSTIVLRVTAYNSLNVASTPVYLAHYVLGKSEAPASVAGLALSVIPGAMRGSRTPSPEQDYSHTLYRHGASFAAGTPVPGTVDASGFVWPWPALGSYTVWAADVDTSGNVGAPVSAAVTVDSALLITGAGISPPAEWLNSNVAIPRGAMNSDPGLLDAAKSWEWDAAISVSGPGTATGALGVKYFGCSTPTEKFAWTKQTYPISAGRTYHLGALLYAAPGNDRNMYLVVDMYEADGTRLDGADTGWGGTYAGYTYGGTPAPDQFTRYGNDFGAGTARQIPASAAYFRIGVWFQYSSGSSSVLQAAEDIRLVDITEARLASVAATAAQLTANDALADAADAIAAAAGAQATADGKVVTFVQTSAPTAEGVGDLWIDSDDSNKLYRWDGSSWAAIRDTGIAAALTNASNAQATADGKIVSFYQTSAPTASAVGDLWIDTDDDNKQYRWSGSSWVSIRDAGIAAAIGAAATAQSTADGKIVSFYQTGAPGSFSNGDLWFDTDDGNKQYVAVGGVWTLAADTRIGTAITAAAGAQATADGKVTTFYGSSAPTATAVGDLWSNTTAGSTRLSRWSGSSWVTLTVIGTGDVDTDEIADNAATEVYVQTFANYIISTIDTGPYTLFTQALAAGLYEVTVSARVSVNPSAGTNNFRLLMGLTGTANVYGRPAAELECSAATGPLTITATIVVETTGSGPWGVPLTTDFEFFNSGSAFGASAIVEDTTMRCTRIKK